jgi:hypothetical protein
MITPKYPPVRGRLSSMTCSWLLRAGVLLALAPVACGGAPAITAADPTPGDPSNPDPGAPPAPGVPDAGFGFTLPDGSPSAPPAPIGNGCRSGLDEDKDQDGYTVRNGDCNDCDHETNPGAFDVPGNQLDEDCSGKPDDEPVACDSGLAENGDAVAAARALGICRNAGQGPLGKDRTWGLVRAAYVYPDGTTTALRPGPAQCGQTRDPPNPLSHGVLPLFGVVKPRAGAALVALSSGVARPGENIFMGLRPSPEGASMCTRSATPPGFPVSAYSTCGDIDKTDGETTANDSIALEVVVRVPTNAASLSFEFDFYTYEYNQFVCSFFNDAFVALLYSKAAGVPENHNIAFDSQGNPVSVNNGFVEVCSPFTYIGQKGNDRFQRTFPCKLGVKELNGTGFERRAATGWLQTRSNVVPAEEITLRFAIWDAGDEILDSTVLIDNFKWDAKPGSTETVRPPDIQ